MKVKEVIKIIEKDGWYLVRQKGSHMQFKHSYKKGLVTVATVCQMILQKEHWQVFSVRQRLINQK